MAGQKFLTPPAGGRTHTGPAPVAAKPRERVTMMNDMSMSGWMDGGSSMWIVLLVALAALVVIALAINRRSTR